jgi:hypothetical protein
MKIKIVNRGLIKFQDDRTLYIGAELSGPSEKHMTLFFNNFYSDPKGSKVHLSEQEKSKTIEAVRVYFISQGYEVEVLNRG